jgi:hypothetical protein
MGWGWGRKGAGLAGCIAASVYLLGYLAALFLIPSLPEKTEIAFTVRQVFVFGLLTVLPPIWFFIESIAIFGPGHGSDEDYKHTQELASRIWVTLSAIAAFYWFHKV